MEVRLLHQGLLIKSTWHLLPDAFRKVAKKLLFEVRLSSEAAFWCPRLSDGSEVSWLGIADTTEASPPSLTVDRLAVSINCTVNVSFYNTSAILRMFIPAASGLLANYMKMMKMKH